MNLIVLCVLLVQSRHSYVHNPPMQLHRRGRVFVFRDVPVGNGDAAGHATRLAWGMATAI